MSPMRLPGWLMRNDPRGKMMADGARTARSLARPPGAGVGGRLRRAPCGQLDGEAAAPPGRLATLMPPQHLHHQIVGDVQASPVPPRPSIGS